MKKMFVSMLLALTTITLAGKVYAQCSTPTQFEVKNSWIEETEATCFWGVNDGPYNFRIYWKKSSASKFDSADVSNTLFYTMENLKKGTQYECYMVKVCGENSLSAPTSTVTFTTLGVADDDDEEFLVADMEDITIGSNQYELPSETNFNINYYDGSKHKNYTSNTLVFAGVVEPAYSMAIGWGVSSVTDPESATATANSGFGWDSTYYTSAAKSAYETDGKNYLFGYYSPWNAEEHLTVYNKDNKYFEPKGVYVSQSLSTYNFTSSQEDLYLKVIATGYDKDGVVTGSSETYLINKSDATVGNPSSWKLLDLTPLGKVAKVKFTLENNDETYWLANYFCIDNFAYAEDEEIDTDTLDVEICANENYNGLTAAGTYTMDWTVVNLSVNELNEVTLAETLCAESVFEFNGKQYTTSQTIIDTIAAEEGCDTIYTINLTVAEKIEKYDTVSITSNELPYQFGELSLTQGGDYEQVFTSANGCDSTVNLHLEVLASIENATSSLSIEIFPNPATDNININTKNLSANTQIAITDINGRLLAVYDNIAGKENIKISVQEFASGVYFVKVKNNGTEKIEKFIKK